MCKLGILKEEFLRGYVNNSFKANIKNTPEQISAFITKYGMAGDITITDSLDIAVITTFGIFLNRCSDQEYLLKHLRPTMVSLQTGEKEIKFIPIDIPVSLDDEMNNEESSNYNPDSPW